MHILSQPREAAQAEQAFNDALDFFESGQIEKAREAAKFAVDCDHGDAAYLLSFLSEDRGDSALYLERAAQLGSAKALLDVAGDALRSHNYELALACSRQAFACDEIYAGLMIGYLFLNVPGLGVDFEEAVDACGTASMHYSIGHAMVGEILSENCHSSQATVLALGHAFAGHAYGDSKGTLLLSRFFYHGQIVPEDRETAKGLVALAAERGDMQAQEILEKFERGAF